MEDEHFIKYSIFPSSLILHVVVFFPFLWISATGFHFYAIDVLLDSGYID